MAFVKTGDEVPVLDYHDNDGKKLICEKCNKPKIVVVLKDDKQEIICNCELDTQD